MKVRGNKMNPMIFFDVPPKSAPCRESAWLGHPEIAFASGISNLCMSDLWLSS